MKPIYEKIPIADSFSLIIRNFENSYIDAPWHYHPEYELTYVVKGNGKRFVGDNISNFEENDLILLGSALPHFWRCEDKFYEIPSNFTSQWLVIQFSKEFVEQVLFKVPELQPVALLLKESVQGLTFSRHTSQQAGQRIFQLLRLTPSEQLLGFLNLLHDLSKDTQRQKLATNGYRILMNKEETDRMKRILEYTLSNFRNEISLETIAEISHLSVAAFCRYFKKRTQKTYINYLNEIRVSHACRMLIEDNLSVEQIGPACGFNNSSNFHRIFKKQTGVIPSQYIKLYKKGTLSTAPDAWKQPDVEVLQPYA